MLVQFYHNSVAAPVLAATTALLRQLDETRKSLARSTAKLARWLERAKGIEPSYAAWEAAVLPLNYARVR